MRLAKKAESGYAMNPLSNRFVADCRVWRWHDKPRRATDSIILKAAEMLNMAAHECMVFEDSVSGIQAAKTAEMYSVGVGNPSELEWADEFVSSLGEYDFHHFE